MATKYILTVIALVLAAFNSYSQEKDYNYVYRVSFEDEESLCSYHYSKEQYDSIKFIVVSSQNTPLLCASLQIYYENGDKIGLLTDEHGIAKVREKDVGTFSVSYAGFVSLSKKPFVHQNGYYLKEIVVQLGGKGGIDSTIIYSKKELTKKELDDITHQIKVGNRKQLEECKNILISIEL
jgi:hypothetical protein